MTHSPGAAGCRRDSRWASTELFGRGVTRSQDSRDKLQHLAEMNRKALRGALSPDERKLMEELRAALPSTAATIED
jgi:hypothetical protein